ncbi:MAG: HypC/HybG/HupF family hydrogenase formation chaperone [Desulfitobacteriaceae bacterium]
MCIAVPAKVLSVDDHMAEVDLIGNSRRVNIDLISEKLDPGDYVLIHAGYAIERIDEGTALETLALLEEVAENSEY